MNRYSPLILGSRSQAIERRAFLVSLSSLLVVSHKVNGCSLDVLMAELVLDVKQIPAVADGVDGVSMAQVMQPESGKLDPVKVSIFSLSHPVCRKFSPGVSFISVGNEQAFELRSWQLSPNLKPTFKALSGHIAKDNEPLFMGLCLRDINLSPLQINFRYQDAGSLPYSDSRIEQQVKEGQISRPTPLFWIGSDSAKKRLDGFDSRRSGQLVSGLMLLYQANRIELDNPPLVEPIKPSLKRPVISKDRILLKPSPLAGCQVAVDRAIGRRPGVRPNVLPILSQRQFVKLNGSKFPTTFGRQEFSDTNIKRRFRSDKA